MHLGFLSTDLETSGAQLFHRLGTVYNMSFILCDFVGGIYSEPSGPGSCIIKQTFLSHACNLVKPLRMHNGFYHVCLVALFSLTD